VVIIIQNFSHLTLEERELFFMWKEKGYSFRVIAKKLRRSHTTLSREWKRNTIYFRAYIPCHAQRRYERVAKRQRHSASLKNPFTYLYVRKHLELGWSPEQIAGRLSLDHPSQHIDDETIYRYIYAQKANGLQLWRHLTLARKRRRKRYGRRVQTVNKSRRGAYLSIEERPEEINSRSTFGHWETDNFIGSKSEKTVMSVSVERLTRFTILRKLSSGTALLKAEGLIDRLSRFPPVARKTITTDNGFENYEHRKITSSLNTPVYFTHPYSSWEKGTVENTNGRLRRYIPRGTMITHLSDSNIGKIEKILNTTPRKCLGFKTPLEAVYELLAKEDALQTSWGGKFQIYGAGASWFKGGVY
jgi:IS30 family transposase